MDRCPFLLRIFFDLGRRSCTPTIELNETEGRGIRFIDKGALLIPNGNEISNKMRLDKPGSSNGAILFLYLYATVFLKRTSLP